MTCVPARGSEQGLTQQRDNRTVKRHLGWAAGVLTALLLTACVSAGRSFDADAANRFRVGQTTLSEVIATLGPPLSTTETSDGSRQLIYSYVQAQARPETFIPVVGAFVGGADGTSRSAVFTFSPDGVLREVTRNNTASAARL